MSHNKSLENDLKLEKRERDDNIISKIIRTFGHIRVFYGFHEFCYTTPHHRHTTYMIMAKLC